MLSYFQSSFYLTGDSSSIKHPLLLGSLALSSPGSLLSPFYRLLVLCLAIKCWIIPRLCSRITSLLILYVISVISLCLCLQLLVMCWWVINIRSSPDLSFEPDPLLSPLPPFVDIILVTFGSVRTNIRIFGLKVLHCLGTGTAAAPCTLTPASFNYVSCPLLFLLPL